MYTRTYFVLEVGIKFEVGKQVRGDESESGPMTKRSEPGSLELHWHMGC